MDIPKPDILNAYLDDIAHAAKTVRGHYRTAEPNAFSRPKHGSTELVQGGSKPDLADTLSATDKYRRLLRHAAREVVDARNRLQGAVSDLNDALLLLDPKPGPEVADVRFLEHPEDAGGVRRAKQAQERRMKRAESSGDYSEVGW